MTPQLLKKSDYVLVGQSWVLQNIWPRLTSAERVRFLREGKLPFNEIVDWRCHGNGCLFATGEECTCEHCNGSNHMKGYLAYTPKLRKDDQELVYVRWWQI